MKGILVLEDGTKLEGESFGAEISTPGEVVFNTGMVGYPQAITDPSYSGQLLVFTYPIIGNYGVPDKKHWESDSIKAAGLIVANYNDTPSHYQSKMSLGEWLKKEKIPGLIIKDTRFLAKKIRHEGTMLGKIVFDKDIEFADPNLENLVAKVSTKKVLEEGDGKKTVVIIDCGVKKNIVQHLVNRGVKVITVPWDYDVFAHGLKFDAVLISNGPGDPKIVKQTIENVKKILAAKIPTFGICLGNQILALAAGGDTKKLKFGHRGQNQPALFEGGLRCYLTTQNHGFVVSKVPEGYKEWFTNANDGTNEGLMHTKLPFMSVQFHPESNPGPEDTDWLFDYFIERAGL